MHSRMIQPTFVRPVATAAERPPVRELEWERPVFTPPAFPNPRAVFDPVPFRRLSPGFGFRFARSPRP
jgi:hypothetical protein